MEPFDPYKYGANGGYPFTEGNAWQYFWYVPQNIPDLISLTGGNKAFTAKLDNFFTVNHQSGELNDNASGFVGNMRMAMSRAIMWLICMRVRENLGKHKNMWHIS